ncbi:hypothetical protein EYF80_040653 [Liparis tanakae]|uniref:Secreted protein n=1 Tax=Liparis tanakae TaxID=230148 RepID=A0A4Z2G7W6_9TELE|nr:hypothetical protein EYF80_040653 [Liparis tanakae]
MTSVVKSLFKLLLALDELAPLGLNGYCGCLHAALNMAEESEPASRSQGRLLEGETGGGSAVCRLRHFRATSRRVECGDDGGHCNMLTSTN